jgi:hypothetical protein
MGMVVAIHREWLLIEYDDYLLWKRSADPSAPLISEKDIELMRGQFLHSAQPQTA